MSQFPMPNVPKVHLENVDYRHWNGFNPRINAFQVTGTDHIKNALDAFATYASTTYAIRDVAIDIETKGTEDDNWWQITCVTAAFNTSIGVVSVLFNPLREPEHRKLFRRVIDLADRLVLHNGLFDIPPLVAHQLITLDDVNKVWDTLVLAKMINTSDRAGRTLEDLAVKYGIVPDDGVKMTSVFAASGIGSASEGFARSDISSSTYRDGAMSDTVVTLRLLHLLQDVVTDRLDATTGAMGARLDTAGAAQLVRDMQRVNQIACRRSARGYLIDPTFPDKYRAKTEAKFNEAVALLKAAGLEPGRGDKLVEHLAEIGELPEGWPQTRTGRLSADKKAMDLLIQHGHPLSQAHRIVADTTKINNYLTKVVANAKQTGRLHPMIGTLGASATGRMCLPTTHRILTDRGVLTIDEVRIGDRTIGKSGTWVPITAVHRYSDAEVIVRRKGSVTLESTAEHRWVVQKPWRDDEILVEPLTGVDRRILLTPFEETFDPRNHTFTLDTDEKRTAALIGLLVSDGRCVQGKNKGVGLRAYVYQTEGLFYKEFRRVIPDEALMYDRVTAVTGKGPHHEMRIKTRWLRPLLEREGLRVETTLNRSPDLVRWAANLSVDAAREFLRALWLSDGNKHTPQSPNIVMDSPELIDATRIAAYKIGRRVSVKQQPASTWGTKPRTSVSLLEKPHPRTKKMITERTYTADVWCVSTEDGTFTAWSDHMGAYLTGNSVTGTELHQFPGDARGILISDHEYGWSSVDWSSIEPVVMAVCAGDNGFLAPFYAGGDLYVPIARAAGLIPPDVSDEEALKHYGRKVAKVVLLAAMYGQGKASLAANLAGAMKRKVSLEEAAELRDKIQNAMPITFRFMKDIERYAESTGTVCTIAGRVLNEDAGYTYRAVNHFCITPDTPILTADLRHVPADTVKIGDELVGFDEYSLEKNKRGGGKRRFRTAVVKNVNYVWKQSVEVHTSDGKVTVCSADHKWFVRHPGKQPRLLWVEAKDLTPEYQMMSVDTWDSPNTHAAGYLAGLFDGEGSMQTRASGKSCSQITFHQNPGNGVMEKFCEAMDELGLTYTFIPKSPNNTSPCDGVRVSGVARMMKTVGMLRPHCMLTRVKDIYEGADLFGEKTMNSTPNIVKVVPVGMRKLVAIETSTHTFIANGYLSHNCQGSAADVLYQATLEIDRQGLADHIHLWMHDELVVDTSVADQIDAIMQTPPKALLAWSRASDVQLKTDNNAMGMEWKSV